MFYICSCNVECQDTCYTSTWSEWSTCKPRHCNENYRLQEGGGIGYQKPSIPGKQNMSQLESAKTNLIAKKGDLKNNKSRMGNMKRSLTCMIYV